MAFHLRLPLIIAVSFGPLACDKAETPTPNESAPAPPPAAPESTEEAASPPPPGEASELEPCDDECTAHCGAVVSKETYRTCVNAFHHGCFGDQPPDDCPSLAAPTREAPTLPILDGKKLKLQPRRSSAPSPAPAPKEDSMPKAGSRSGDEGSGAKPIPDF